jgi:putative endonuclease
MARIDSAERARRGAAAEDLASCYLRLRGCEIVGRNVRAGGGEIDLIARTGDWLLLVEVRYRETIAFGHPVETVCGAKARSLARAARAYVARGIGGARCWRLDVVTVILEKGGEARVQHYPAAVTMDGGWIGEGSCPRGPLTRVGPPYSFPSAPESP